MVLNATFKYQCFISYSIKITIVGNQYSIYVYIHVYIHPFGSTKKKKLNFKKIKKKSRE